MKKIAILITMAAVLLSSCTVFDRFRTLEPTPTSTIITPTETPDPCGKDNVMQEITKVQEMVNEFQDIAYIASYTPQTELVVPILEMQSVRRALVKMDVPFCTEAIKTASINYMNSSINSLAYHMAAEPEENRDAAIENSQILWEVMLSEFNKLLLSEGLSTEKLPNINDALPPESNSGVLVGNDGTKGVNVRREPDLGAKIISSLEPGMQAIGLARNETGDWLLVNLDGIIGWVFAEMVIPSVDVDELPVSEPGE